MDADAVLKFYDSCWFEGGILTKQAISANYDANPVAISCQLPSSEPEISSPPPPTLQARSMSDQSSSLPSFQDYPPSSKSAILQTILSGKEAFTNSREEEGEKASPPPEIMSTADTGEEEEEEGAERRRRRRGRRGVGKQKKGFSKSLSDLEFEELKGFIDLGFVFSEEDKDSSLVSVIPGLQRLGMKKKKGEEGKKTEEEEEQRTSVEESVVSRPYLSEAWDVLGKRKDENPLKNWMIPASNNEVDVKDNLRWWAQAVASTVR